MITLYSYELSGNCYKVRLFLSILGLSYTLKEVEFFPAQEHKSVDFMLLNPMGQLPVLDDGGFIIRDAQAILTYLAHKYATGNHWYPTDDAERLGETNMWMAFANELTGTSSAARMHQLFNFEVDMEKAKNGAYRLFRVLDEQLWFSERKSNGGWVCQGEHPTVADIACFPYVILADEGGVSLVDFPAIRRWTDRVKRIPNFILMPGVFPAGQPFNADKAS